MSIKNLFVALIFVFSAMALAKRIPPAEIKSVLHEGIIYAVPHYGVEVNSNQNGGYIQAINAISKETIWVKRVYKNWYFPFGDVDSQDVFITSIKLSPDKKNLLISNERHKNYELNLKTKKVKKLKSL